MNEARNIDPAALRVAGTLRDYRGSGKVEAEFELQLTDSSYVPLDRAPLVIIPGMKLPAALIDTSPTGQESASAKGGITSFPPSAGLAVQAVSLQELGRTGNFVEATLFSNVSEVWNLGGVAAFGLLESGLDFRGASWENCQHLAYFTVPLDSPSELRFYEYGTLKETVSGLAESPRVQIMVNGSEVSFRLLDTPASPALFVSALPPVFPVRAFLYARRSTAGDAISNYPEVRQMRMTCGTTFQTFSSSAQRAQDYGSTSATAYGLLYVVGGMIGKGRELRVTF